MLYDHKMNLDEVADINSHLERDKQSQTKEIEKLKKTHKSELQDKDH